MADFRTRGQTGPQSAIHGVASTTSYSFILRIASVVSIILFFMYDYIYARTVSINVPIQHLDGAFQTASGLFRLDSGQLPGEDFLPYLGIGPLFSLYPVFKALGASLTASVFSAHFMTLLAGWISISVLWHFIFRPGALVRSFAAGAVIFISPMLISSIFIVDNPFSFSVEPGNSLRPIRAIAPYLVAMIGFVCIRGTKTGILKSLATGILAGTAMLWSNDFAVSTVGLFSLFIVIYFFLSQRGTWVRDTICFAAVTLIVWMSLFFLATNGHPFQLLRYNFIDVAGDQWWYFAPLGEGSRVFLPKQILRIIVPETHFPLIVLFVSVLIGFVTKKIEDVLVSWIGMVLFAGGAVATLGGHIGGYFAAFNFWGIATAVIVFLKSSRYLLLKFCSPRISKSTHWSLAFPTIIVFLLSVCTVYAWNARTQSIDLARNDVNRFYVEEFNGYLDVGWKDYIEFARRNKDKKVTEEYWGLWSALNKTFPSWPVNSVIHALGRVRDIAKRGLEDTDFIITTRYANSPIWQPWIISQNYWLYQAILTRWDIETMSPTTIVWRRRLIPRTFDDVPCEISPDKRTLTIKTDVEGFYQVSFQYETSGKWRYIPLIRNNISLSVDRVVEELHQSPPPDWMVDHGEAFEYVSLDPHGSSATIPMLITKTYGNVFDTKTIGNRKAIFSITSCVAQRITYDDQNVLHSGPSKEFYLTDANWNRGVARHQAVFFVPNIGHYPYDYVVGSAVRFLNGEIRKIIAVKPSGLYLTVYVDGDGLDPETMGTPDEYTIVK